MDHELGPPAVGVDFCGLDFQQAEGVGVFQDELGALVGGGGSLVSNLWLPFLLPITPTKLRPCGYVRELTYLRIFSLVISSGRGPSVSTIHCLLSRVYSGWKKGFAACFFLFVTLVKS